MMKGTDIRVKEESEKVSGKGRETKVNEEGIMKGRSENGLKGTR